MEFEKINHYIKMYDKTIIQDCKHERIAKWKWNIRGVTRHGINQARIHLAFRKFKYDEKDKYNSILEDIYQGLEEIVENTIYNEIGDDINYSLTNLLNKKFNKLIVDKVNNIKDPITKEKILSIL